MDQMPKVKGKVCVTGAAGFLASWLIKRLLSSDYHVTGTVREPGDEKKAGHLWKLDGAKERLCLVRGDLMIEGSFDEAIMGCVGVFHTASPVLGHPTSDPEAEILKPAIDGTLKSQCVTPVQKKSIFEACGSNFIFIDSEGKRRF